MSPESSHVGPWCTMRRWQAEAAEFAACRPLCLSYRMSEMEISILVNIALGIVLFALFRWKGRDDGVRLQGSAEAMQIFRSQFPDVRGEATLAADGRGALIDIEPGGAVGILERRGRRWNARVILPGDPSSAQIKRDVLCIRFADFGWPRSCLRIA